METGALQMPREVQVHYTRTYPRQAAFHVHFVDDVHPGGHHHHRLIAWHGSTGQPGARPARHERAAMADSHGHASRDLFGALGKADNPCPTTPRH